MPITPSTLTPPSTPSLSDFRTALHRADQLKHTDIHINRQGTIRSSRPNWGTRFVRFLKARIIRRPALSEHSQHNSIDAFRQAIAQKQHHTCRRGVKVLQQQVTISKAHRIPINTTFYRKVLNKLDQQNAMLAKDHANLKAFVNTFEATKGLDDTTKQKLIDRSFEARVDHNDVGRIMPLEQQQIKGFIIRTSRQHPDIPTLG